MGAGGAGIGWRLAALREDREHGASLLARRCHSASVPHYVVADFFKLDSRETCQPLEAGFQRVPAALVTAVITEDGLWGGGRVPCDNAVTLGEALDRHSAEGELYRRLDGNAVLCYACGHRCVIREGLRGICKVRYNRGGRLYVPRGYVAALQCDPTEKKPFFHLLPGSLTMTFGMLGCDFHCPFCQNWVSSQALRDPQAGYAPEPVEAEQIAALALRYGASLVGSSYNEPLITSEWAVEVFRQARQRGLRTCYVSNGNATPEVLEYLRPWLDACKIDLKCMADRSYRRLGGVLSRVLDTIRAVFAMGFWVEVVTLVVPGFNDSEQELREAARFLASVSPDIPWHVTAFHGDYRMQDVDSTGPQTLARAAAIGREEGLRFVYAGNVPGALRTLENTCCPGCNALLVERRGFRVLRYAITGQGACPGCGAGIPGVWWPPVVPGLASGC